MTPPLDKPPLAPDAGEPQRTEKEAREREELLRFTFDSAPVGIYMADLEERYLKVNIAYQRMVGYPEEELRNKSIFSLTYPDDLPRNQVLRGELIAGKREFFEIEKRYYAKSGGLIWVRNKVSLIKNALGGPRATITVSQDITERRLAADALRQSQQNYAALVNSVDGIVWEADAQTFRFNFVSQQAERLLGYPVERWLGESTFWKDHIHPDDREWAVDFCVTATREKRAHDFEYRMLADDGRTVWVRDIVTVVVENDRPVRLRGIMVDITERKLAEQARQDSERRLRQALEDRERLAQDLHDGIVQQIYAIGLGLEETQRLVAENARAAGQGLAGAIAGLNEVIREVRRHIAGSVPQILDGQQLRAELQALARTVKGAQRLRFRVEVDPKAVSRLPLDAATQVLNIAREAMSNSLRHSRASSGLVSLRPHRHGVRLTVEDDGIGFDPRCADSGGQGLRNIAARARQLSARLDVGPRPTGGTRIVVDIPVEMHDAE